MSIGHAHRHADEILNVNMAARPSEGVNFAIDA
jgi:hypothetical protein